MTAPVRDPGSFRDPNAYVFADGERIVRAVMPAAHEAFGDVYDSGILGELNAKGLMIGCERIEDGDLEGYTGARGESAAALYSHPRVPFLSYPYEWVFSQLKDAALAHLDLQIAALDKGFVLSDATAYNMQFIDGKPVHIDVMSVRRYKNGEHWDGYNQFCRQFVLPLLIEAWAGVSFQPMYRGSLNGISFEDAMSILPKRKLFTSLGGFMHVYLHGKAVLSNTSSPDDKHKATAPLPKARYKAILKQLRNFVADLKSAKRPDSYWKEYAKKNSYSEPMRDVKLDFVGRWGETFKPATFWDIGGNTGDFSMAAIEKGAGKAVILDADLDSLEGAYRLRTRKGDPVLPVMMNMNDPTPALGWRQTERKGLAERADADGIIALAVIHHMVIGGNLPFQEAVDWLMDLAPCGIIEFVPKRDPMVKQLLAVREDIFPDYTTERFREIISSRATIVDEHEFEENGRLLVSYKSK
ncbi:MAG: class I SAM-dependent methyltransferase [Pseudomonadota bacterium]